MKNDLNKKDLYQAVKILLECDQYPHIHLIQHKLFTLYSIAFQYFLYRSTKYPGAYIIRIEDSILAEKLVKKAKDPSSRKFLQALLLPRKLKYDKSVFYLDFFQIGSWKITNDIPKSKIQGALIIKNSTLKPMTDNGESPDQETTDNSEEQPFTHDDNLFQKNFYLTSLQEFVPKTIIIAYNTIFENVYELSFPFIKRKEEKALAGVTLASDLDFDDTSE